jgi:nicotinate phosphoribosyltransferase
VLAEQRYGIPAFGTMAHSFVESFDDEIDAFRAFARMFPGNSTLLVDTYDTLSGVRKAAIVGAEMAARGQRLSAVRLDSGDLFALSQATRAILDVAGLPETRIFASGGLNEYKVADLVARGAPIDAFGVGTDMGVSGDAPWLDCAYKLVEYAGRPRLKLSSKKVTLVGRKQVWRAVDAAGGLREDCVALREENAGAIAAQLDVALASVQPRLCAVMRGGVVSAALPSLDVIRGRFREEFRTLPEAYKALRQPAQYPVRISAALRRAQDAAAAAVRARIRG